MNPPKWIKFIQNKKNFLVENKQHAYDLDDPLKEAEKAIEHQNLYKQDISVIVGCGLGYLLQAIIDKREEKHRVIVAEPEEYFVEYVRKKFSKKELKDVIFCANTDELNIMLEAAESGITVNHWHVMVEQYAKLRVEYMKLAIFIQNKINQISCNTGTVRSAGSTIADNDILNLPYVIRHPGIKDLIDLFKGKPAVTVSTGPSLEKNIHVLKKYKNDVVIIAVGQALRVLLGYDIKPDFICTVDFGEVNMAHFKGLMDSNVPLICLNRTYAPLLKQWQGPKFITCNIQAEDSALSVLNDKGTVMQGGSVAHLCLSAAAVMGCNPIMMIGQDLALGDKSHIEQADAGGKTKIVNGEIMWEVTDQRTHLHGNAYSMGAAVSTEGFFGGYVLTNSGLASFITAFENMIKAYKDFTVINCTQGGARIKHTKQMTLQHAINKYCKEKLDKKIPKKLLRPIKNSKKIIDDLIPKLEQEITDMKTIIRNCNYGISTGKKILKAKDDVFLLKELKKNEKYSNKAFELSKKITLVQLAIFNESKLIQTREMLVSGRIDNLRKNKDDLKIRVKRNRLILEAAIKASKRLKEHYQETIKILKLHNLHIPFKKEPIDLADAHEYLNQGNFAHPYIDAKKVLKKDPDNKEAKDILEKAKRLRALKLKQAKKTDIDYENKVLKFNYLIEQARKIGKKAKDWTKAKAYLNAAEYILPKETFKNVLLWGKASVAIKQKQYDIAIKLYKQLPDEKQYQFELGLVYVQANRIPEALELFKKVMADTSEFDYFLEAIGDLYIELDLYDKAIIAYQSYLNKFPGNIMVWRKLKNAAQTIKDKKIIEAAQIKIVQLR